MTDSFPARNLASEKRKDAMMAEMFSKRNHLAGLATIRVVHWTFSHSD